MITTYYTVHSKLTNAAPELTARVATNDVHIFCSQKTNNATKHSEHSKNVSLARLDSGVERRSDLYSIVCIGFKNSDLVMDFIYDWVVFIMSASLRIL